MLRSTPAEADSIAIRLGGIYALQQYAVDSRRPDDVEGAEPHDEATSPAPRHRVPPADVLAAISRPGGRRHSRPSRW